MEIFDMKRLDALTLPELNKLYKRSRLLHQLGILFILVFLLTAPFVLLGLLSGAQIGGMGITVRMGPQTVKVGSPITLLLLPGLGFGYMFLCARDRKARVFFYIWSAVGILLALVSMTKLPQNPVALVLDVGIALVCLAIFIQVLLAARSDYLFGDGFFTRKQLALACQNRRKNIPFTDEQLPETKRNPALETAGLVLACVSELFIVVSVVVLLTTTGFGPRQSELSAEELAKRMEAAENGDAEAQCLLADAYFLGNGVEQDEQKAVEWFRKSAEQGHAVAEYALGNCYFAGRGIEKDEAEAFKWFLKSAEHGYAVAQYTVGSCYFTGRGVSLNKEEAIPWLRKAAAQGEPNAKAALKGLGL